MRNVDAHNTLRYFMVIYTKKGGGDKKEDIVWGEGNKFDRLAKFMSIVGQKRYIEVVLFKNVL